MHIFGFNGRIWFVMYDFVALQINVTVTVNVKLMPQELTRRTPFYT